MIRELLWAPVAWAVSRRPVVDWLIQRAVRTPYSHIPHDGSYMERYWLFNAYDQVNKINGTKVWHWRKWLPSIRLHKINRADSDDHMHDHPWDARTIILRGMYIEQRLEEDHDLALFGFVEEVENHYRRNAGDTARVLFGQYHRINTVSKGGVWTMFITYKYRGTWGFLVNGVKVKWKEYLGVQDH
jgi:hypothetical protein